MSYYKSQRGDKIRKYWQKSPKNAAALRDWMRANGLKDDISMTVFCRLEQHEEKRDAFLNSVKTVRKKQK
jgi:MinD-like ATPase involved in chromosome partitioning or flagellar assembly